MNIQSILYLTLGFSSQILFGLRFFIQWILSERKGESYITSLFWVLSIIGNILVTAHYLVQVQFHLYVIRFFPLYFAFRELSLMRGKAKPFSWPPFFKVTLSLSALLTLLFLFRVWFEYGTIFWIENLKMPWESSQKEIHLLWHGVGFIGGALFMSRLWVQWWQSEQAHKSYLSPSFWWLSIYGGVLTLIYALYIQDYVTACGYVTGLIPYVRNLMLTKKSKKVEGL